MKAFLILVCLIPYAATAADQFFYVDLNRLKEKQEEFKYTKVTGQALSVDGEKDGQLRLYVRGCGKISIPRNSKGDIPKKGQTITATLKERCLISDWK